MMKTTDSSQIKIQYIKWRFELEHFSSESGKIMIEFVHEVSVKLRISNGNKKNNAPKGTQRKKHFRKAPALSSMLASMAIVGLDFLDFSRFKTWKLLPACPVKRCRFLDATLT